MNSMGTAAGVGSTVNYEAVFNRRTAESLYGDAIQPLGDYYDDERGFYVKRTVNGAPFTQDFVQFAPDVMAFTSAGAAPWTSSQRQVVGDDWIHFCIRLGAGGVEDISDFGSIEQPSQACMITRYPAQTHLERIAYDDDNWRVACLWVKPTALRRIMELSSAEITDQVAWLTDERPCSVVRNATIPVTPRMQLAVNDIVSCGLSGGLRRTFEFAKYLELATHIYQGMSAQSVGAGPTTKLSEKDNQRIAEVHHYLRTQLHEMPSLAELARRVGINRTKLVVGFRYMYGTSVEAFWRDCRLQKASELLHDEGLSVSEVAFRVGYSEVSSFSRAFSRKYGIMPKSCRLS